jgi:hypothetical protein
MTELAPLLDLFSRAGLSTPPKLGPGVAHAVAYGHRLVSLGSLPGVSLEATPEGEGLALQIRIGEGVILADPIHLCFGLLASLQTQKIRLDLMLEPDAQATLWSHCLFATDRAAQHAMQGEIRLGPGAVLRYQEAHYHGPAGEIQVIPRATVILERGARYLAEFSLLKGRVGRLDLDQRVQVGEEAVAELVSRVYGQGQDQIRICEQVCLNGAGARGLVKTRVAVREQARAEVLSHMEGNAAGARGHLDCMEVVRDQAVVSAIPELRVSHPQAKLTHEAAIGSVDSRQLETLMARGLAPDEAVDVIVRGMLA